MGCSSPAALVDVGERGVRSSLTDGEQVVGTGGGVLVMSPKIDVSVGLSSSIVAVSTLPEVVPNSSVVAGSCRDGAMHCQAEENWGLSFSLAAGELESFHGERLPEQRERMELVDGGRLFEQSGEVELVSDERSSERGERLGFTRDDRQGELFLLGSQVELVDDVGEPELRNSPSMEVVDRSFAPSSDTQIVDAADGLDMDEQKFCSFLEKEVVDGHGLKPSGLMELGAGSASERRDKTRLGREIELATETTFSDFQLLKERGGDERRPGSFLTVADSLAANLLSLVVSTGLVREETIQSFGDLSMKDRIAAATQNFVEKEKVTKVSSFLPLGGLSMRDRLAAASKDTAEKEGFAKGSSSSGSSSSSSDSSSGETGSESSSPEDEVASVGELALKDSAVNKISRAGGSLTDPTSSCSSDDPATGFFEDDGSDREVAAETELERVVEDERDGASDGVARDGICDGDDSVGYDDLLVSDASAGDTSAVKGESFDFSYPPNADHSCSIDSIDVGKKPR
ncbi:hypothetical protein Bca4012_063295 [Brassica carinata]